MMAKLSAYHLPFVLFILITHITDAQDSENTTETLKFWADALQSALISTADVFARKQQAQQEFSQATLELRNDSKVAEEITEAISAMMNMKIEAVKRIVDIAEQKAQAAKDEEVKSTYSYYNAKCLKSKSSSDFEPCSNQTATLDLTPNPHFWNLPVNIKHSAVHVPTNVFDRSREVLKAIKWSEELDGTFRQNYNDDPSLSWQYFGSSTGFMRQYPAMEWKQYPVDLYDCRTRSWYIEAAASPKDMVILVDHSGSMTGVRKEIARHVVDDILDTLGNNDYVNILKFSEHTTEVVDCFENRLVQANLANIRSFKQGLEDIKTDNIANFSLALQRAFDLLSSYRDTKRDDPYRGGNCNQAIMLITDGVPYNYQEIFNSSNWPDMPVRVFTYLVGREVPDVREIRWMACANRGYYVHLSTQAEVREQVLQYVPVMARPLVLTKNEHPVIWTPVYADVTDPKMTDWIWERKEFAVQKRVIIEARHLKPTKGVKLDSYYVEHLKVTTEVDQESRQEYKLMTSVSIPVFDKRDHAILWVSENVETLNKIPVNTRVANLLGVAGTDVPISEIKKLMDGFKLGVNGYAFIVTNNGYILYHPDLRAEFHGILKPNYNSVDFVEIEIIDDKREPREFNQDILNLRRLIVEQAPAGHSNDMKVMYHLDELRRGGSTSRRYHYVPIRDSPFTVVIAVPLEFGSYRVNSSIEIKLITLEGKEKVADWFGGRHWRLHPDWVYCKYANESYHSFKKEEELCHFLGRSQRPGWRWPNITAPHSAPNRSSGLAKDSYYCDRDLIQSVVYDAKYTRWFNEDLVKGSNKNQELKDRFGITTSFIATRSGLTRWQNYSAPSDQPSFGDAHPRAIDEVWYRRAVNYWSIDKEAYVYSVPFDSGNLNDTLVTVSRAIFVENGEAKAPAAVVGFQFQHRALRTLFFETTSKCPSGKNCATCTSEELDCFILDDNGYVIVSENKLHTGQFFGLVEHNVMHHLVSRGLYKRVRFIDYQSVCFKIKGQPVIANSICKPVHFMTVFLQWIINNLLLLGTQLGLSNSQMYSTNEILEEIPEEEESFANQTAPPEHVVPVDDKHQINKTRPESCDQEINFYNFQYDRFQAFKTKQKNKSKEDCDQPFYVERLFNSNLIFVVVNTLCPCKENCEIDVEPIEIDSYNNTLICHKFASNNLPRRRPPSCISRHDKEPEIDMCGRSSTLHLSYVLYLLTIISSRVT